MHTSLEHGRQRKGSCIPQPPPTKPPKQQPKKSKEYNIFHVVTVKAVTLPSLDHNAAPCLGKLKVTAGQFANSNSYSKDWASRRNSGLRQQVRVLNSGLTDIPCLGSFPTLAASGRLSIRPSLIGQRQCCHAASWSVTTRKHSLTFEYQVFKVQRTLFLLF